MSNCPLTNIANISLVDDVDQWSEALIVKPEVAADVVWPHECPAPSGRQLYQNSCIFIQVKKDCTGTPMTGTLSIVMEEQSSEAWCRWEPAAEHREIGSEYEFRARVAEIHSIKVIRANMGYPQVIINLQTGCSPPPFFFPSGSVSDFRQCLGECVQLRRGDSDPNTWVNAECASCSSPVHGASRDDAPAQPSKCVGADGPLSDGAKSPTTAPTTPTGDRLPCKEDETQWRWRALQGGVSVVRNLRKGWAHACNATLDVAAAAAELLDKSSASSAYAPGGAADPPDGRLRAPDDALPAEPLPLLPPPRCGSPPSPLLIPRPNRGDSFASAGSDWEDCAVLVEHEHEPWQARPPVSLAEWNAWFDAEGRLQAQGMDCLRHAAYYGGLSPQVRRLAWPYLLGCYPPTCSAQERAALRAAKVVEYQGYRRQWTSVTAEQAQRFGKFRERKHRIDKDVVRTDRGQAVFASEEGEGLRMLHDVLLSYAFYNFDLSYCQGMSDLASPLVAVLQDEIDAFWCFQRLMEQVGSNFHKDQNGMHAQLQSLHRICKVLEPGLVLFLEERDCAHFYFCFRWLLILFKRELPFVEVQRVWEALWARVRGPDLHLFLAMAILRRHAPAIIQQKLGFDELLKYINDLALTLDIQALLVEADALYQRYNAVLAAASPAAAAAAAAAAAVASVPSAGRPGPSGGQAGLSAASTLAVPVA